MGKSFSLPDISARYNLYSAGLLSALSNTRRDWDLINFNVESLNTLLTSKYTIPISTELYKLRTNIEHTRNCKHCFQKDFRTITDDEGNNSKEYFESPTKISEVDVKLLDESIGEIEQIILKQQTQTVIKTRKYWVCPKCSNTNYASESPTSDQEYGSSSTFGVIYERPKWTILNRSSLDILSMTWVTDFMREVDVGLMAYQKAYFEEYGRSMDNPITPFTHEDKK